MKVVFMGTPDFAVPSLNALLDAGHQVEAVFTQPDKAKGRGKKIICSPVKELAVSRGIPVYQPPKVREKAVVEQIRSMAPDVIVVVAFGQIFEKPSWIFRFTAALMSTVRCCQNTEALRRCSGLLLKVKKSAA